jgi:hypothetical protein
VAQVIAAPASFLPGPAVVLMATGHLKHPLGGDESVTDTLLAAIARAVKHPALVTRHKARQPAATLQWGRGRCLPAAFLFFTQRTGMATLERRATGA